MAKTKRYNNFATYGNTPYFREKLIAIVLSSFFTVIHVLLLEITRAPSPMLIGGTALLGCVIVALNFLDRRKEQISVLNAVVHVLLLFASMYLVVLSLPIPWWILICTAEILMILCACALSWQLRTHPAKHLNQQNSGRLNGKRKSQ